MNTENEATPVAATVAIEAIAPHNEIDAAPLSNRFQRAVRASPGNAGDRGAALRRALSSRATWR
jgi:hypothetical protein